MRSYPDRAALFFSYDEPLSHLIYAASDMFLVPSMFEPCGLTQVGLGVWGGGDGGGLEGGEVAACRGGGGGVKAVGGVEEGWAEGRGAAGGVAEGVRLLPWVSQGEG